NADWSAVTVELNPQNFDGVPPIPIVDSINQKFDSRFGSTFTTETYTSRPIGEASSTRRVVVAIAAGSDHTSEVTVTGVTIGGVTSTIHVQNTNFSSNKSCVTAIASAVVPTGTTATVAVTFSGATKGCTVWTVPLDKGSSISAVQTLGVDASSGSIARQPGDYVLAVGCAADAQSNYPWMYDGADKIGDTYDHNGAKVMMMAGQRFDPAKGESELIQYNWYGAASRPSLAAVTFR
ncbi:MAG: hypothetical protein IOC86_06245, partial [Aestuariivirga sp.]|nr:hypothetical protein [Aestuariivirga sp.]